jgi:hypothetical protein
VDLRDLLFDVVRRFHWRLQSFVKVVLNVNVLLHLHAALFLRYFLSLSIVREALRDSLRYFKPCLSNVSSFLAISLSMVGFFGLLVLLRELELLLLALPDPRFDMDTLEDLFFIMGFKL